ncbi:MAG: hypothetical protein DYG99_01635 [Bacteroidetes bacterium CHB5]|nr:hypothetical protein [Bacteroidetes bacterium CHB5]
MMRIRRETAPLNWKMFVRITLIVFIIFSGLMMVAKALDDEPLFSISYSWVFSCILQPLILGYVYSSASRRLILYVNDYQHIDSFKEKLNQNILNKGVQAERITETESQFVATGWFYKLFNRWNGNETITVQWGDEVVITGSSRIVSQVEDSLTWNPAFK